MSNERARFEIVAEGNSVAHPIGTICYEFRGHDYGCAREDTQGLREPCIALTLNSDGTGPFFTAPTRNLNPEPTGYYGIIAAPPAPEAK